MIKLGPLLGIEGDYQYSLMVLLDEDVEIGELRLITTIQDSVVNHDFSVKEKTLNYHFYRFSFDVSKSQSSYPVSYSVELNGQRLENGTGNARWEFVVPGEKTVPKVGFASCNGDDKRLPDKMTEDDFVMWDRLIKAHNQEEFDYSFHCLLLGGDQIYADPIWDNVGYFSDHNLLGRKSSKTIAAHTIASSDMQSFRHQVEKFYEDLYVGCWSRPEVSKVLASIPSMMMWDDHDIFDGWGSYPDALQQCEIFVTIFSIAKKYFELFQIRSNQNASLISTDHFSQRVSFRNYEILVLDNRSHRTPDQIMSDSQYSKLEAINHDGLFSACPSSLQPQRVLLFVVPVPIAHLNYKKRAEGWLAWFSKNNFRKSLDDDALDHWDHHRHEGEQKKLIDLIYAFGDEHDPKYVHIVSGDVHSAGAGRIERTTSEPRYVNQLISSAIVYKPIGKLLQRFVHWASEDITDIPGYRVRVDRFGIGENAPANIYERNFGFLYKGDGLGTKFYLILEHNQEDYKWDQPRQFNPNN